MTYPFFGSLIGFGQLPSNAATGYAITNAVWFDGVSDYLTWTPGVAADSATTTTISCWVKLNSLTSRRGIFGTGDEAAEFFSDDKIHVWSNGPLAMNTNQVFRDPTAWMNVVFVMDTTQATNTDRVKIFVNGARVIDVTGGTWPTLNDAHGKLLVNAVAQTIGQAQGSIEGDFYLAEYIVLDGVASTDATEFGEFNDLNEWVPIDPSGLTFGTNGFWLDMKVAPGTGSGSGTDVSGNGNHFTEVSMTAVQQVSDVPTTDISGDKLYGNIPGFTALDWSATGTFSGNAHYVTSSSTSWSTNYAHIDKQYTSGKVMMAMKVDKTSSAIYLVNENFTGNMATTNTWYAALLSTTTILRDYDGENTSAVNHSLPFTYDHANDYMLIALDADAGVGWGGAYDTSTDTFYWMDNSTGLTGDPGAGTNPTFSSLVGSVYRLGCHASPGTATIDLSTTAINGFPGTLPTGYEWPMDANFETPTITDPREHHQVELVDHDGSSTAFTLGWSADTYDTLFIIKNRDNTEKWYIVNGLDGYTKYTSWDSTAAQTTDSNVISVSGTTITLGSTLLVDNYVVECHKAGLAGGASNTEGTITTTVSANTTSGFSIMTYTGTAANATLGHGLTAAPDFVIAKGNTGTKSPVVTHIGMPGTGNYSMAVSASTQAQVNATVWNSTRPTSTLVHVGSHADSNPSSVACTMFAWHSVEGYSKFGSYEGNDNLDGAYVDMGFSIKSCLIKNIDAAESWVMLYPETALSDPYFDFLHPNTTAATNITSSNVISMTSNGMKQRNIQDQVNVNTLIYSAFAEHPVATGTTAQSRGK